MCVRVLRERQRKQVRGIECVGLVSVCVFWVCVCVCKIIASITITSYSSEGHREKQISMFLRKLFVSTFRYLE